MTQPFARAAVVTVVAAWATLGTLSAGPAQANQAGTTRRAAGSVEILVAETAGIRRFGYPVHARVPFAKGELDRLEHMRLVRGDGEVAAQFAVAERWDDGSVRWAYVDWNASPPPLTTEAYRLECGPDVRRSREPRGLTVTETDEAFQVGLFRFRKDGWPLIESCMHAGGENIGRGRNGLVVTDTSGKQYDFRSAEGLEVELVKPGPVHVVLRYRGRWAAGDAGPIHFETELAMPNSKSWWKVSHRVRDPHKRLRSVGLYTPFLVDALPVVWDFGTGSWTYGALRRADQLAVLEQSISAMPRGAQPWTVLLGPAGDPALYEVAGATRPALAEGWGHLTGGQRVVAFGVADFGLRQGVYRMALSGGGAAQFAYTASTGQDSLDLTVYQHFVGVPVQIGAATSPPSMLNPLVARCPKSYYERCGVPVPEGAR
jgi:hypothetical protein